MGRAACATASTGATTPRHRFDVVHERADGVVDGYVSYRIKEDWDFSRVPRNEVQLGDCVGRRRRGRGGAARLPRRHRPDDVGDELEPARRRPLRPAPRRLAPVPGRAGARPPLGRASSTCRVALAARRYESPGTLVLAVDDAFRPARPGGTASTVGRRRRRTCERSATPTATPTSASTVDRPRRALLPRRRHRAARRWPPPVAAAAVVDRRRAAPRLDRDLPHGHRRPSAHRC